ncbi:dihydrofolate reductase family protein [Brachybacterium huguangmaarense]|uniref:Dihydrofolate reductase family protein n=1 Tax=Brachybacterium huguangmaarense TaxID=1652028 RepID=A0ABY6FYE7_9MICO|nr:dihydrofolate reductase family protein [Brachybacterium huguangmaarense]UYG15927.1 dihydrofolate reductase family protein [Brachybacterium huguangmaarense]
MSRIYVANHVTLDGVMQGPGRVDEDTRGGFTRGGWAVPRSTEEVGAALQDRVRRAGGMRLLLGHRSYADMLGHWNAAGGPFKDGLNGAQKHVVSRSRTTALPWPNSTLISGDVAGQIAALKASGGPDLCIMGSGELVQTLLRHRLLDEVLLFVHPIVLGSGRRLFPDGGVPVDLELLTASAAENGVVVAQYRVG